MAKVDINVELDAASAFGSIGSLKQALERLDTDIDLELDNLEEIRAQLKTLRDERVAVKLHPEGLAKVQAAKAAAAVGPVGVRIPRSDGGGIIPGSGGGGGSSIPRRARRMRHRVDALSDSMGNFGATIRRAMPTMRRWWALLGFILPVLIAVAVQALGVAAALGAVAVAGAAVLGLGLLGWGDDLSSSLREAKEQLKDLAEGLHSAIQPAAQAFAPVQSQIFDMLPGEVGRVASEMRGLTSFSGILIDSTRGLVRWFGSFFDMLIRLEPVIEQLTRRFGNILGEGIINFFEALIMEGFRSQDTLIRIGRALSLVIQLVFNLSVVFSNLLAAFNPILHALNEFAKFLRQPLVAGIVTAVGVFGLLTFALGKAAIAVNVLMARLILLGSGSVMKGILIGIAGIATKVWALTTALWSAVFASEALIIALSALTLGTFAIGAVAAGTIAAKSMGRSRGDIQSNGRLPGGATGTTTVEGDTINFNIQGNPDRRSIQSIRDVIDSEKRVDGMRSPS